MRDRVKSETVEEEVWNILFIARICWQVLQQSRMQPGRTRARQNASQPEHRRWKLSKEELRQGGTQSRQNGARRKSSKAELQRGEMQVGRNTAAETEQGRTLARWNASKAELEKAESARECQRFGGTRRCVSP